MQLLILNVRKTKCNQYRSFFPAENCAKKRDFMGILDKVESSVPQKETENLETMWDQMVETWTKYMLK